MEENIGLKKKKLQTENFSGKGRLFRKTSLSYSHSESLKSCFLIMLEVGIIFSFSHEVEGRNCGASLAGQIQGRGGSPAEQEEY